MVAPAAAAVLVGMSFRSPPPLVRAHRYALPWEEEVDYLCIVSHMIRVQQYDLWVSSHRIFFIFSFWQGCAAPLGRVGKLWQGSLLAGRLMIKITRILHFLGVVLLLWLIWCHIVVYHTRYEYTEVLGYIFTYYIYM